MTNLDPASLADSLGTLVLRDASTATLHFEEGEDGYWCVSCCTFTFGDSTRDDRTFAWGQPDLERWLADSSANRDLVWRYHLRPVLPSVAQLESVVQHLVPVWREWNQL